MSLDVFEAELCQSEPFSDQQPGTSGLRKSVKRFQTKDYVENFIQSFFQVLNETDNSESYRLIVGGDGRYFSKECVQKIIQMSAANPRVQKLYVAQSGIMSTPAISCCIRKFGLNAGIILTASHNPGGPDADFGIKFNCSNGGPAPQSVTDKIYEYSKKINQYERCANMGMNVNHIGKYTCIVKNATTKIEREFSAEVIDSVSDYSDLMKEIFDFEALRIFIGSGPRITINAMSGVMGPYVKRILCSELGLSVNEIVKCEPLEDFGGHHPDP
jgi:phosphoglucomutase